jgi:hypothetical protein
MPLQEACRRRNAEDDAGVSSLPPAAAVPRRLTVALRRGDAVGSRAAEGAERRAPRTQGGATAEAASGGQLSAATLVGPRVRGLAKNPPAQPGNAQCSAADAPVPALRPRPD